MSFKKDLSLLSSTDSNDSAATTNSDSTGETQRERGLQHKTGDQKKHSQLPVVRRSRENFRSHSMTIGDIGSGKNLIGDAYLASLLANRKPDDKFVLFDPKGTIQQLLGGLDVPYTLSDSTGETQREQRLQAPADSKKAYHQVGAVRRSRLNFRSHTVATVDVQISDAIIADSQLALTLRLSSLGRGSYEL